MSERKINGTNVHILPDENLGGVLREFIEVDRPVKKGDFIVVYGDGHIYEDITVDKPYLVHDASIEYIKFYDDVGDERMWDTSRKDFSVIEPTDIVHIDGKRYRVVERKARPDEKIILIKPDKAKNLNRGDILIAQNVYDMCVPATRRHAALPTFYIQHGNYCVLESINNDVKEDSDEPITVDESQAHPQVIEMLANLFRRIVALEKKINRLEHTDNSLHRDIETWAQEVERLKSRAKTEFPAIKTFNLSEIKTFNLSDLDGRTLHIVVTADTEKESGLTTRVAFGRDVNSGEMFVLGYEVNTE